MRIKIADLRWKTGTFFVGETPSKEPNVNMKDEVEIQLESPHVLGLFTMVLIVDSIWFTGKISAKDPKTGIIYTIEPNDKGSYDPIDLTFKPSKKVIEYISAQQAKKLTKKKLKERIELIKTENEMRQDRPYVDKNHTCGTCKAKDHLNDPENAYCWHCRTDNWEITD